MFWDADQVRRWFMVIFYKRINVDAVRTSWTEKRKSLTADLQWGSELQSDSELLE